MQRSRNKASLLPAPLTCFLSVKDAIHIVRDDARALRACKTRHIEPPSEDVINGWSSAVMAGLAHRYPQRTRDELGALDVRLELLGLAEAAEAGTAHRQTRDAAGRVRAFFERFTGVPYTGAGRWGAKRFLDERFAPMVDALERAERPHIIGQLADFNAACKAVGYHNVPFEIPSPAEVDAGLRLLDEAKWGGRNNIKSSYRIARRLLLDQDPAAAARFPDFPTARTGTRRNATVLSLDELHERFPTLADDHDEYQEILRGEHGPDGKRSVTFRERVTAAICGVAGLYESLHAAPLTNPELASTPANEDLSVEDFFAVMVTDPTRTKAARRRDRRGGRRSRSGATSVCLLRRLIDMDAPTARKRSRFKSAKTGYTQSQRNSVSALRSALVALEPEGDEEVLARAKLLVGHVEKNLIPDSERGDDRLDKHELYELVTLPQVQLLGLPWFLHFVVAPAEAAYREAALCAVAARHDPASRPDVCKLQYAYEEALEQYLMLAIACDDGLRMAQYAYGRWGSKGHFRPELADGVLTVKTYWRHDYDDPAGIKNHSKKPGAEQPKRLGRALLRGAVCHRRLDDYVFGGPRERRLRERKLLAPGETYDPLHDSRFALFISNVTPTGGKTRSRLTAGCYTGTHVSNEISRALYRIITECLGRSLPPYEMFRGQRKGLLTGHCTRTLIATYYMSIRRDVKEAMFRTLDLRQTLENDYDKLNKIVEQEIKRTTHQGHWRYPTAYDAWMERLERDEDFDPLADPTLPMPDALRLQLRKGPPKPRAPRMRKARPEHAERMRNGGALALRNGVRPSRSAVPSGVSTEG